MIKFFRKIRYDLIKKNKTGKYLKYAVGEIVLVMIGILLALQVSNWNQRHQNGKQETILLTQLLNEYSNNLIQLNSKIETRDDIMKSSLTILDYRGLIESQINVDSLNMHIARTLTRPTFDAELGVTNELTNSGKLYYLTNTELRNSITAFPSFLSELREEEMVSFNLIEERLFPFLIDNYQLGAVLSNNMTDHSFQSKIEMIDIKRKKMAENLFNTNSPFGLVNNPDMEDYMALTYTNTEYTNLQSLGVKSKIEDIINLIKKEIVKKE
ncbi:hypothetical protein FEE95_21935 [Maribacter algarum]|uniref:Uncharacterized protein n=1 Tax=Maribacter algarum (ex Zhang et al. 2020) TaxID=2578118 RepID=A0A5S3PCL9_9FLAO|nr:DUF6090 family protein [Maribacter algarum]TMM51392.1 hypothetical protein FEE95_21935 [Maribacter algarum]